MWREDVQAGSKRYGELDERFQRDINLGPVVLITDMAVEEVLHERP